MYLRSYESLLNEQISKFEQLESEKNMNNTNVYFPSTSNLKEKLSLQSRQIVLVQMLTAKRSPVCFEVCDSTLMCVGLEVDNNEWASKSCLRVLKKKKNLK